MSEPVSLTALAEKVAALPVDAFLMTVNDDGTVHVVSAAPRLVDGVLHAGAGSKTRHNADARPSVTVLWPLTDDPRYCLIVDGTARPTVPDADLAVEPTKAILHRLATADPSLPNCVTVGAPRNE